MKQILYFALFVLCLLSFGCSKTDDDMLQSAQKICAVSLMNDHESLEKQCCLKDSLEKKIKYFEQMCAYHKMGDSYGISLGEKSQINDSDVGFLEAEYWFRIIEKIGRTIDDYFSDGKYLKLIIAFFGAPLILLMLLFVSSFKLFKKICGLKKTKIFFQKLGGGFKYIAFFVVKILFNNRSYNILSPTDEAERFSNETFNQLKFAIIEDNPEIKNVAITGPYGAGKSSVWKTFCKKAKIQKFKNVVEISLAKFNDPNDSNALQTYSELEIERIIIQQFVFSKKNNDLKYSNFSRINNLTDLKTVLLVAFLFTCVSFVLPLTSETILYAIISWLEHPFQLETIYVPILLSFLYVAIFFAIQKINKIRVSKICLKDVEVTLDNGESLFDKYISEVVYFFEATKCNCVVIEDLDRFKSLKIFSKLREINNLINNYPKTKNKVKFVYLVKDDILTAYERTKFFDFIIPVVPILNGKKSTVAYIKTHFLRKSYKDPDKKPYLDDDYLMNMANYLTDLRLVKNCFNELEIYRELNPDQLHGKKGEEKIFSIILFKNLYPKDFQYLSRKKGVLYYCLNQAVIDLEKGDEKKDKHYLSQIYT